MDKSSGVQTMIEKGQTAPNFCLNNAEEKEICLSNCKGKWVVLYFYPKDNTPGCTTEAIDFTAALPEFQTLNTQVLGISADSCKSHQKFILKQNLEIELLSDPNKKVLESYGAWQLKKMYGREYMGIVRSTFLIDPEGIIQEIWPKVRVKGHVQKVLESLKNLQRDNA